MKIIYTLIALIVFLNSCKIEGTFQGLTSYKKYYKGEVKVMKDTFYLPEKGEVYLINAKVLKEFILRKPAVLVYMWKPKCRARVCIHPKVFYHKCLKENFFPIIVAEYYDYSVFNLDSVPVFIIDTKYYRSNFCSVYKKRFLKELMGKDSDSLFLELHYGKLVKEFNNFKTFSER